MPLFLLVQRERYGMVSKVSLFFLIENNTSYDIFARIIRISNGLRRFIAVIETKYWYGVSSSSQRVYGTSIETHKKT